MTNVAQRTFAFGELAPGLYARAGTVPVQGGLRVCRNGVVLETGGVRGRPGTTYQGTTKGNGAVRVLEVTFDDDQNYLLELGVSYVRFWRDGEPVEATGIVAWVTATPYAAGVVISSGGFNYVCTTAHTSGAGTEPGVGGSWATVWYLLSGAIYELPLPYTTTAELRALQAAYKVGVVWLVHPDHERRVLTRVAEAQWTISSAASAVSLATPQNLTTDAPTPGTVASWKVTAYDGVNLVESLPSSPVSSDTAPNSPTDVFTQSWDAVTGATSYRIYRSDNGSVYGFVREVTGLSMIDTGILPNFDSNPPEEATDWSAAGDYPGAIGAFQQRLVLGGTTNNPTRVQTSRVGAQDDFTVSAPLQASDAVSWQMAGARAIRPRHFVEVGAKLIQFSSAAEHEIRGDDTGILTPTGGVNPAEISKHGAAKYPGPLVVDEEALFVQARGSVVRSLGAQGGRKLSLTASHLVTGYTIIAWCFQANPDPVVWAVRSDGVLLSLTLSAASGVLGWARHDTDGTVEDIACVPEGEEDAVYLVVNRTIDGGTVRYIERLAVTTAALTALCCSDASVTGSGVHPHSSLSLDLSGAIYSVPTNTTAGIVATGSGGSGSFTAADVGRTFKFVRSGTTYTATVTGYTSATVVTISFVGSAAGWTDPTVVTAGNWYWTSIGGLSHLEGEAVSVVVDGAVYASPYNPAYTVRTVVDGAVDLGNTAAFTTAIVGLPFVTDIETLDIERAGSSVKDRQQHIGVARVVLEDSRGCWAGPKNPDSLTALTGLEALTLKDDEGRALAADEVRTGPGSCILRAAWTEHGRVFLRNVDPSPFTLLAVTTEGAIGGRN